MQDTGIYKIILWGAGNTAKEALEYISDTVVIIGILDNNPTIKEFGGGYTCFRKRAYLYL